MLHLKIGAGSILYTISLTFLAWLIEYSIDGAHNKILTKS